MILRQKVNSRGFALFELACASVSSLVWFVWPQSNGWPLLLALLPWLIRISAGQFPFRRTLFDLPILIFLLTAGLGVWVSYNTAGAWDKFWLLLGGIFIYYALANQPRSNLPIIAALAAGFGSVVALSLLFDNNLPEYTSDLDIIDRILAGWEKVRPALRVNALSPNVTAGILAILLPLPLYLSASLHYQARRFLSFFALLPAVLILIVIFLSSSRGAWFGIAVAVVVSIVLLILKYAFTFTSQKLQVFLLILLIVSVVSGIWLAVVEAESIANLLDRTPGFPYGTTRLKLITNSWDLWMDFPFSGGGLRAFPGLYSQYILIIPFLFLEYSHHLYMDILLEQGILGILPFLLIFFGSLFIGMASYLYSKDKYHTSFLQLAVIAGLVILGVHGLIDDPIYGMRGTPLLFLLPGINASLREGSHSYILQERVPSSLLKYKPLWGSVLFVFLFVLFLGQSSFKSLLSDWYANLGSIYMSKAELRDFPSNSFDSLSESEYSGRIEDYFSQALSIDPGNVTSHYRLGLLSSQRGDYGLAISHLEEAHEKNSRHRGIRKALGYNYAWASQPELAAELLSEIPEARYELDVYTWWWNTQNRADLAENSQAVLEYIP